MPEGVNSHEPQEPRALSFSTGCEPMVVMTEETRNLLNRADRGGGVTPCRATDGFTGLPMRQAALEFASIRHAGQYREGDRSGKDEDAPYRSSRFRSAHAAGRCAGRAGIWPISSAISGMACGLVSSGGNRG